MNKRKILESAQKHLQRGALDKALEDYQTLLKADPKDANIRLKIGDLHLKLGRSQDAIDAYLRVAQQFTNEGFDAKAVALYKQISKLDEKRFDVHAQLGELYQRMGLGSEAMRAMQLAADGAHRSGDKAQALSLLRRMAALDPTNTASRLKVADLLRAEGQRDDALAEYDEVVRELERQRNTEEQIKVLERALELAPERGETLRALARAALEGGAPAKAERAARTLLEGAPDDLEALELLGTSLERAGRSDDAAEAFRGLAERFRARGDEDKARALMQRWGAGDALEVADSEPPVLEGDASDLELDPELDASLGLAGAGDPELGGGTGESVAAAALDDATLEPSEALADDAASESGEIDPDADFDQLLAEASVFSRYGKHERAIETLRAALRVEPGSAAALEKLGESLAAIRNRPHATSSLQRAAAAYAAAGDGAGVERVRALLAPLDAKAAAALQAPPPPADADLPAIPGADSGEIDIEIDPGLDDDATPEPREREPAAEDFSGIEVDVSSDFARDSQPDLAPPAPGDAALDDSADFAFDAADGAPPSAPAPREKAAPGRAPAAAAKSDSDSTSSVNAKAVAADFEEAEFYREQGLLDEARALYERVLAVVPHHPRAKLRLGELAGARASAAKAPAPAPSPETTAAFDLDLSEPDSDAADDAAEEATAPQVAAPPATAAAPAPPAPAAAPAETADPLGISASDFDLAAELSGAFDEDPRARSGTAAQSDGFEEVFAAFKAGVKREVDEGDTEAHYDLGIAYKEMGLLEDAIGEFRVALGDPARRITCLHLMGLCALELGRAADAIAHLSDALAGGAQPREQEAALRLDLGRAHRAAGDPARARTELEAARRLDPNVAGVAELLAELEQGGAPAAPAGGETFESFDDLIGEQASEAAAARRPPPPQYESFDELTEADEEAAPVAAEPAEPAASAGDGDGADLDAAQPDAPAAEPTPPPPPAPPVAPPARSSTPAPGPARRKKKISFV